MLAGPGAVADDPEAATVRQEVHELWESLPAGDRRRVHLANIPTDDVDENATIVNALQRHAAVVVQKSLAEGFGLTVTEAMWKGALSSPEGSRYPGPDRGRRERASSLTRGT
jgi:trehalose synthase